MNNNKNLKNKLDKLIPNKAVLDLLYANNFFNKEYLTQEFTNPNLTRFKSNKILQNNEIEKKYGSKIKLTSKNFNELQKIGKISIINEEKGNLNIQLNKFVNNKEKLRYFTFGSKQRKQFENYSPQEMFDWWLQLRLSNIPKRNWQILDSVFFLLVNQITTICNSYIQYGYAENKDTLHNLRIYLDKLDEFYKGNGRYELLLGLQLSFCDWFESRMNSNPNNITKKRIVKIYKEPESNNDNKAQIEELFIKNQNINKFKIVEQDYIKNRKFKVDLSYIIGKLTEYFMETLKDSNFSLLIFTSYFQNIKKFLSFYSIPVIQILGLPWKTHDMESYSPYYQIYHDFIHAQDKKLDKYLTQLYQSNRNNYYKDVKIFKLKELFLTKLRDFPIDKKQKDDAEKFLWWFLHEYSNYPKYKNPKNIDFFQIDTFKSQLESFLNHLGEKYNKNNDIYIHISTIINNIFTPILEELNNMKSNNINNLIKYYFA